MDLPAKILKQYYNITPIDLKKMAGYGSLNFRVTTNLGRFVLKLYEEDENLNLLEAENDLLQKLVLHFEGQFPQPVYSSDKNLLITHKASTGFVHARLLTFLDGKFFAEVRHTKLLLESFGQFLGKMNRALLSYRDLAIEPRIIKWDNQHALLNHKYLKYITDYSRKRLVDYFFLQFKEEVQPHCYDLRKSVIHNDANDWNVLTQKGKVSGMIDFGDMAYSWLINEMAIAITYAAFDKPDPLKIAASILKGYHTELPLEEKELQILYYLVATRLCVSVCNSAYSKTQILDNEYITISEKPAFELLEKWIAINPIHAENEFRKACGLPKKTVPKSTALLKKRNQVMSSGLSLSYKNPIYFEKAALQYMYSADGKTYLDAYNNIKHVGHCHPKVVEAIQRQAAKLNTNTRYLYDSLTEYAELLLKYFPPQLNKVFFVNSGSAATDLALRMARAFTGKKDMLAMEQGYHGNTIAGVEVSHYKFGGKGGSGEPPHTHTLPLPTTGLQNAELNPANWKASILATIAMAKKNGLAGMIAEAILGCAGQVSLPKGYLQIAYEEVRRAGGVCIADEVQIGFGRTGKFWGWEHHDVIPDMVILGKPMGNGHPIGAVVTTSEIAEAFDNGMEFFSSFGGNPVSCAVGKAVLEVIEEEQLMQNALEVGNYFKNELLAMQQKYPIIYDVRGEGLFLGIEFRQPGENSSITPTIKEELKKRLILTSTDGPGDRTLKVKPPLVFSRGNVDRFLEELEGILKTI